MKRINEKRDYKVEETTRLEAVVVDLVADVAALDGRTTTLESNVWSVDSGDSSFDFGSPVTISSSLAHSNSSYCEIHVERTSISGTPGTHWVDNIIDDTSFDVTSTDATDKGNFRWWVRRKAGT